MREKALLSWDQFHRACDDVTEQLRGDVRIKRTSPIIAVPRGGMVAAAIVAYGLRLDRIWALDTDFIQSSGRDDLVVIDDICDTGKTFKELRRAFPNAVFAAPFVKMLGRPLCAYWSQAVPQDTWIVMPYAPDDDVNR
jgi:hypoxanthine phosphoribosyltransferase